MRTTRILFTMACAALMLATSTKSITAQENKEGIFIPIGAGYGDTYDGLIERIVAASQRDTINILVIASAYSTNSTEISESERAENDELSEGRRLEVEEACIAQAGGKTCNVTLAHIYTHDQDLL